MTNRFGRRKFLLYGSATMGTAMLLKACGAPSDTATTEDAPAEGGGEETAAAGGGDTIKVGILHSLSGTMAISETTVVDAEKLAIKEINEAGGVLGKQIEYVEEDGASDWPTFAEKAEKLIDQDQVVTVFGCWTSASRKAVLPVFESKDHMLWYPCSTRAKNVLRTFSTRGLRLTSKSNPLSTGC